MQRFSWRLLGLSAALLALSACGDKAADKPATPAGQAQAPVAQATPATPAAAPSSGDQALFAASNPSEEQAVVAALKQKYPNLPVESAKLVNTGGATKLYSLEAGGQLAYTDQAVSFILVGGELLMGTGTNVVNVTQKTIAARVFESYKDVPMEGALEYVYGKGERDLVIFTDPDCPFCQALEVMMEANRDNLNARVTILPYPLDSVHPDADRKSRYLLCTQDPNKAWKDWMLRSAAAVEAGTTAPWAEWAAQNPSQPNCERAKLVDRVKEYGKKAGYNQTPILVFSNGMPFLGLLNRDELERAFSYVEANPAAVQMNQTPAQQGLPAPAAQEP